MINLKIRLLLQPTPVCLSWALWVTAMLRAWMVLTWGLLCPVQAGAEGREGEACGTVGLLLEHSFEIGESGNVLS